MKINKLFFSIILFQILFIACNNDSIEEVAFKNKSLQADPISSLTDTSGIVNNESLLTNIKTLNENLNQINAKNSNYEIPKFYLIVLFLIFSILLISIFLNYIFLRWRLKYKNQFISIPESLLDQFSKLESDFTSYKKFSKIQASNIQNINENIKVKSNEILDSFLMLNKKINEKDQEIERFKKGYDFQILRKYILKLTKFSKDCDVIFADPNFLNYITNDDRKFIDDYIKDLLNDLNVFKYDIQNGISIKSKEFGIPPANQWVKVQTNEKDKLLTVKKTLEKGYYYLEKEISKKEVLIFPKIEVYIERINDE